MGEGLITGGEMTQTQLHHQAHPAWVKPTELGTRSSLSSLQTAQQAGECLIGASAGLNLPGGSAGFCFFQAAVVSESSLQLG